MTPVQVAGWVVSGLAGGVLDVVASRWRAWRDGRANLEREVLRALLATPYGPDREGQVLRDMATAGARLGALARVFQRLERKGLIDRDRLGVVYVTTEGTTLAEEEP